MKTTKRLNRTISSFALIGFGLVSSSSMADVVHLDDVIVNGSACIGFDCVNGEVFGFDTLKLRENNLRIKFDDTSAAGSFPANDWQLTANDSSNGGLNKFSIDDVTGGRTPFTVEAGAPSSSLYVDDGGRVGLGTSVPVVGLHRVTGNTPTLRLEQNGSSGFTPQTWDVAGNEAGFFVRDTTNGSTLPFRIRPGAPSNSLVIDPSGKIGLGTLSPKAALDIHTSSPTSDIFAGMGVDLTAGPAFNFGYGGNSFGRGAGFLNVRPDAAAIGVNPSLRFMTQNIERMIVTNAGRVGIGTNTPSSSLHVSGGNIRVSGGSFIDDGTTLSVPDYVFEEKYELMPLDKLQAYISKEKHLPGVKSAKAVKKEGLNISLMQLKLLEKIEELTLYTLDQEKRISSNQKLKAKTEQLSAENSSLKERLASLEKLVTNLASNQQRQSPSMGKIASK